jgi:DNA polymerase III subunit delta'
MPSVRSGETFCGAPSGHEACHISLVPIIDIYGHNALRERLGKLIDAGTLPGSLLLHGDPGVGKQRLALWIAQYLLCSGKRPPCGECQHCRFARQLTHPDLYWFFPRPRPKDTEASVEDVIDDLREAVADRAEAHGLYERPAPNESLYFSIVRAIVHQANLSPALSRRKVFVIGEADRMVPQEGSEQAANAFLKVLEEPPADTTIILTSSEPGSLLPTIRSRAVAARVQPLSDKEIRAFLADERVVAALRERDMPTSVDERIRMARGAPGRLLRSQADATAEVAARRLLDSVLSSDIAIRYEVALASGSAGARANFAPVLDQLTELLHDRARAALERGDTKEASGAAVAADMVEEAKLRVASNVNPQLLTAHAVRNLGKLVTPIGERRA